MPTTIEALLFDLGGVVIEIDFGRIFTAWSHDAGVPAATIASRFSFDSFYAQQERGEIDRTVYFESLRHSLQIDLTDEQFDRGWKTNQRRHHRRHRRYLSDRRSHYANLRLHQHKRLAS